MNEPAAIALKRKIALALAAVTFAIYLPTAGFEFVNYDDGLYVTDQPMAQKGLTWEGFLWAFTNFEAYNWHPVTWLSHMLDCSLFGMNPAGPHLVNALIHALNAALLFLLLNRTTGQIWLGAIAAALFAWHPLRVESVAWVAERKDVLSVFFGLLAMLAYARYVEVRDRPEGGAGEGAEAERGEGKGKGSLKWYALALSAFALSLMAKATLVTLPCALLLLDVWPLRRFAAESESGGSACGWRFLRLAGEKVPFFALAAAISVVTILAQDESVVSVQSLPLSARLAHAPVACVGYLGKTLIPVKLAVFYPHPQATPMWQTAFCAVLLAAASVAAVAGIGKRPFFAVGWFWFLGTLAPVIGIVQVGAQAMADRYAYVPHIGLFVGLVWLGEWWLARWNRMETGRVAVSLALVACLGLSVRQSFFWRNSAALFAHAISVTGDNYLAYNNLGAALALEGRIDEAVANYEEALRIHPGYANAHQNLGTELAKQGQSARAIEHLRKATELKHGNPDAFYNLGVELSRVGEWEEAAKNLERTLELDPGYHKAWSDLGVTLAMRGDTEAAIASFRKALAALPDNAQARGNLATALAGKGLSDEAAKELQAGIALAPRSPDLIEQLGGLLLQQGRTNDARPLLLQAARIRAEDAAARADVATRLADEGRFAEASVELVEALRLQPGNASLLNLFGTVLARKGDLPSALARFDQAVVADPDHANAHFNRAMALEELGRLEESIAACMEAVRLKPDWSAATERLAELSKKTKEGR